MSGNAGALAQLLRGSGDFERRGDNLVAKGLPGRGKSGFVAALTRELAERHEMKVLFAPAFKLAARLVAAKRELKLVQTLSKLNRYDAILVDELGGYVESSSRRRRSTSCSASSASATRSKKASL